MNYNLVIKIFCEKLDKENLTQERCDSGRTTRLKQKVRWEIAATHSAFGHRATFTCSATGLHESNTTSPSYMCVVQMVVISHPHTRVYGDS